MIDNSNTDEERIRRRMEIDARFEGELNPLRTIGLGVPDPETVTPQTEHSHIEHVPVGTYRYTDHPVYRWVEVPTDELPFEFD